MIEHVKKLSDESQALHRRCNELVGQLEIAEVALMKSEQEREVLIRQQGAEMALVGSWQRTAEMLQRELTRARFVPPRLESANETPRHEADTVRR
jgi:hypothetical protein